MEDIETLPNSSSLNTIEALRQGFRDALRYWKIPLLFFAVSLFLALLAALPFRNLLLAEAGNSLLLKDLVAGFNYTFLNDFLQNYGAAFTPVFDQSYYLLLAQFFILIFLVGGLTKVLVVQSGQFEAPTFWGGSGQFFWRMLQLTAFFLVLHVLVFFFFGWLYLKVTKGMSPAALESEGIITSCLLWLVPLYVLVAAIPFMWQDYTKVYLVRNDSRRVRHAIRDAFRFMRLHFRKTYSLYLLNIGLILSLLTLNYFISGLIEIKAGTGIMLSFLLSQLFVILRYALKVVNMGSVVKITSV